MPVIKNSSDWDIVSAFINKMASPTARPGKGAQKIALPASGRAIEVA